MGKKCSAACRATATAAAAASAATPSPAVPFDVHATLDDTPPASTVRESPTDMQHPRISHEADVTRAPRAASPTHLPVETTLVLEPAHTNTRTAMSVAIAMLQACTVRALEPCPEPPDSPPTLTMPTSTSSDVSANSPQQSCVSNHANTITAPCPSFSALSVPAAAGATDLMTAIDVLGPPAIFFACPVHFFDRANEESHEPEMLAPCTCPTTSIEEIDEELLENIIEDAQNATRIEAQWEIRVKALAEG